MSVPSATMSACATSRSGLASQGIGVRSAPPRDSSLPKESSVTTKLEVVPFVIPLPSSVSPGPPVCGRGKMSALLETDTTRSTALRYAGRVRYWRVGRKINSASRWIVWGGFDTKYVRRVLLIEARSESNGGGKQSVSGPPWSDCCGPSVFGAGCSSVSCVSVKSGWSAGGAFSLLLLCRESWMGYDDGKDEGCETKEDASCCGTFGMGNSLRTIYFHQALLCSFLLTLRSSDWGAESIPGRVVRATVRAVRAIGR